MDFNISHKLKLKFLYKQGLKVNQRIEFYDVEAQGQTVKLPRISWTEVILDLENEPQLFKECCEWLRLQSTYFKTSYRAMKINIGPFEGLFPSECDFKNSIVTFLVDDYIPEKTCWKDWFVEGEQYAS